MSALLPPARLQPLGLQPVARRDKSTSSLTSSTRSGCSVVSSIGDVGLRQLGSLVVPASGFDPSAQLTEVMRLLFPGRSLPPPSVRAVGVAGSVWLLGAAQHGGDLCCLKLVSARRRVASLPTDAEHCETLLRKYPGLLTDRRLAFPHSVIRLHSEDGDHAEDLLVCPAMPGYHLGQYIARLDRANAGDRRKLEKLCEEVGTMLADFHARYSDPETGEPECHRDFHPGNVLFDDSTGLISFVDLTGMGTWGPKDDVEKFARLIKQLAGERCESAFTSAYGASAVPMPTGRRTPTASDTKKTLLYSTSSIVSDSGSGFRHLNILVVPSVGFDPANHLTVLAWLVNPGQPLSQPSIRKTGYAGNAWILSGGDRGEAWALKQVSAAQTGQAFPTEAERCEALAGKFPALLHDARLGFPDAVVPLHMACEHVGDLLISRALPGEPLSTYMKTLNKDDECDQLRLAKICREVGTFLADFHARYADPSTRQPTQHGNFHPGNILYDKDKANGSIGVVGLSHMGTAAPNDVDVFEGAMRKWAGERYATEFLRAYHRAAGGSCKGLKEQPNLAPAPSWWLCGAGLELESELEGGESSSESEPDDEDSPDGQCSLM